MSNETLLEPAPPPDPLAQKLTRARLHGTSGHRRQSATRPSLDGSQGNPRALHAPATAAGEGYAAAGAHCFYYPSTSTCDHTPSANTGSASDIVTPLSAKSRPPTPDGTLHEPSATAGAVMAARAAQVGSRADTHGTASSHIHGDMDADTDAIQRHYMAKGSAAVRTPTQEPPCKQMHRDPAEEDASAMCPLHPSTTSMTEASATSSKTLTSTTARAVSRTRKVPMDEHIRRGSHAVNHDSERSTTRGAMDAANEEGSAHPTTGVARVEEAHSLAIASTHGSVDDVSHGEGEGEALQRVDATRSGNGSLRSPTGVARAAPEPGSASEGRGAGGGGGGGGTRGLGLPLHHHHHRRVVSGVEGPLEPSSYLHQKQQVFKPQAPRGGGAPGGYMRGATSAGDLVGEVAAVDRLAGSLTSHTATATSTTGGAVTVSANGSTVFASGVEGVPLFETAAEPRLVIPLTESRFAANGISRLVSLLCARNRGAALPSSAFHSHCQPPMSVKLYMERIERYCYCSGEAMLCGLMLMLKYVIFSGHPVTIYNAHRLLITSTVLGIKMRDDVYYNNVYYARIGGIAGSEMNKLEVAFLSRLSWEMDVRPEDYAELREILTRLTENVSTREGFLAKFARQHPEAVEAFDPTSEEGREYCTSVLAAHKTATAVNEPGAEPEPTLSDADLRRAKIEGAYWKQFWESVVEPWLDAYRQRILEHAQSQSELERKVWADEEARWAEYHRRDEEERLSSEGGRSSSSRWMSPLTATNGGSLFPSGPVGGGGVLSVSATTSTAGGAAPAPRSNSGSLVYPSGVSGVGVSGVGSQAAPGGATRYANFVSYNTSAIAGAGRPRSGSSRRGSGTDAHYAAFPPSASTAGGRDGFGIASRVQPTTGGGLATSDSASYSQPRAGAPSSALNINAQPYQYVSRRHRRDAEASASASGTATDQGLAMAAAAGDTAVQGGGDRNNFSTVGSLLRSRAGPATSLTSRGFAANTISAYNTTSVGNNAPHIRFTNWQASDSLTATAGVRDTAREPGLSPVTAESRPLDGGRGVHTHHQQQQQRRSSQAVESQVDGGAGPGKDSSAGGGRKRPKPDSFLDQK